MSAFYIFGVSTRTGSRWCIFLVLPLFWH